MKALVPLALGCSLLGCVEAMKLAQLKPLPPYQLSAQEVATIEGAVRKALKDPGSAQFGKMVAGYKEQGLIVVCGLVNAKNSYGGYIGMSPFSGELVGRGYEFTVAGIGGNADVSLAISQVCAREGLYISDL